MSDNESTKLFLKAISNKANLHLAVCI